MKTILKRINTTLFFAIPLLACIAIYSSMANKFWAAFIIALIAFAFFSLIARALNKKEIGK